MQNSDYKNCILEMQKQIVRYVGGNTAYQYTKTTDILEKLSEVRKYIEECEELRN